MPEMLAPGVWFEPVDRSRGGIAALRTDVAAFVGIAERGPLDRPVRSESWEQFRTVFGGPLANGYMAYAAKAFFENGGRTAWFVRVAADPVATASAAAAQPADRRSSVVESTAGFLAGAVVTVEQAGLRRNHRLAAVEGPARRLVWDQPLEPGFDLALPLAFATGAATSWVEIAGADGRPTLRFDAVDPGAWGDDLVLRLHRTSPAATASAWRPQPLDRKAVYVQSVAGFAAGALVRLFQAEPARAEAWRVVHAVDAAAGRLAWDEPLPAGFDLTAPALRPLSLETVELGLAVLRRGRVEEAFTGLSLVASHPRYIETALAGSRRVRALDLQRDDPASSPWPARLPDPAAGDPVPGFAALRGGRDGIAVLTPERLAGEPGSEARRGLRALEAIDEVSLVAIPDLFVRPAPPVATAPRPEPVPDPCALDFVPPLPAAPPPPPPLVESAPRFPLDRVLDVQQALVAHCEALRDRVALLDPPPFEAGGELVGIAEVQAWRARFDSSFAALYFPWVRVADPRAARGGLTRDLPPSGHVAGVIARTDLATGVHKAPANAELRWMVGLVTEVSAAQQEVLNPLGINCLRSFPGRGLRVYGARTLASDTVWRYLPVRRLLLMIEEALEEALQWAVFEPNGPALRQAVQLAIASFLTELWAGGALAGSTPEEAFFARCDEASTPPAESELGRLIAEVGVAPTVPAEFVVFRIGRTEDSFEVRERQGGGAWQ